MQLWELDATGTNRGLSFDREMLPARVSTFRVKVVRKIVDDKTGRTRLVSSVGSSDV
jgi:hypothetical protein